MKKPRMNMMRMKLVREILNSKIRFLAITFVVVVGITIFIASSMSYRNLDTSYKYTFEKLNFADFRVKAQRIPQSMVRAAEDVPGVTMVTARVKEDTPFVMPDGKRLVGRVTGIPQRPIVDDLLVKEGRFFEQGDHFVCLAESHFAKFYDLHPGDVLMYGKQGEEIPIEIVGIVGSPEYLVLAGEKGDISPMLSSTAMGILWMPISDVQWMTDMPGQYNELLFKVEDPKNMDPVIGRVEELMKHTGITELITQDEHLGNRMMQADLEGFRSFAMFFPLLFLGIACFSIYILLSRLVYTQRPFVGVMRAMGYSKKQILMHYLSFALIIGVLGAIFGAICGYGLSRVIAGLYAGVVGIPLVKVNIYWSVMFQGMLLSVAFCAFAGLMPALKSASLDPASAMRGETLETKYKKPFIERVFPPLSRIPMFLKIPNRNMFRNRRRTVFTIIGLLFSVMLVLMFLGILNTIDNAMTRGFNMNNRFDMVAIFLGGRNEALIDKIQRIDGVESVEPAMAEEVKVSWDGKSSDTMMMGVLPDTEMKHFRTASGEQVTLTSRHILMNQYYNLTEGIDVGDTVTVSTNLRERSFIVGDFIEEPMGNLVYIPREEARKLTAYGQSEGGGFYVKVKPGQELSVRESLEDITGLATILDLAELKREIEHFMSLFYIIIYVMLAFALVMAFTLTFNTITINILEREREIATMRTIGTESWKISTMITIENLIFGLLSIAPGCILGVIVGRYAMSLQNTDYMTMTLNVYSWSYIVVAIGILVILVICQIPSLRYVKRVELAQATKERAT